MPLMCEKTSDQDLPSGCKAMSAHNGCDGDRPAVVVSAIHSRSAVHEITPAEKLAADENIPSGCTRRDGKPSMPGGQTA